MFQSLNSLRGVFALFIFFHHVPWGGRGMFIAGGDSAVAFFLILSGFVLYLGYDSRFAERRFSYRDFLVKRFGKVYPMHWMALAATLAFGLLSGYGATWKALPLNVLLLQSWIPCESVYFSFNSVAWYLSVIVAIYAIFPLLMGIALRSMQAFVAGALVFITGSIVFAMLVPEAMVHPLVYIFPLTRVADFLVGMLLAMLYRRIERHDAPAGTVVALELAAIVMMAAAIFLYADVNERFTLASYWWLPVVTLILAVAIGERRERGFMRLLLCNRLFLWLGAVSFAFFVFHPVCIKIAVKLCSCFGADDAATVTVAFLLSLFTAFIFSQVRVPLCIRPLRKSGTTIE